MGLLSTVGFLATANRISRLSRARPPPTHAFRNSGCGHGWVTDPAVRRADVEAFIADGRNLGRRFHDKSIALHTSGSQGQAAVLRQERRDFDTLFQLFTTYEYITAARLAPDPATGKIKRVRSRLQPA